jgi:hypothetical protein
MPKWYGLQGLIIIIIMVTVCAVTWLDVGCSTHVTQPSRLCQLATRESCHVGVSCSHAPCTRQLCYGITSHSPAHHAAAAAAAAGTCWV